MNPALLILIVLILVVLWFLLSFLYKPLGKLVHGIWKDAVDIINEDDEKSNEKGESSK